MKIIFTIKDDVSLNDTMKTLAQIYQIEEKIRNDPHTNKHYILKDGKMWIIGDGTGKYLELLFNSRKAQKQALEMMKI